MKGMTRFFAVLVLVMTVVALAGNTALGQAFARGGLASSSYDVTHHFTLRPGGDISPQVWGYWHVYALADGPNRQQAGPRSGWLQIPQTGEGWHVRGSASTAWAQAEANSAGVVNAYSAGGPVTGTIHAWGSTSANAPWGGQAEAHAWSAARVTVLGRSNVGWGRIIWRPVLRSTVWGQAFSRSVSRVRDPIDVEIFDLEGNTVIPETRLLDIMLRMESPGDDKESTVVWREDNVLAFNVLHDAELGIVIDSPWVKQKGILRLNIRNGKVSEAVKSGIFDGLVLPEVGSSGVFSLGMPELELDYDFGFGEEHLIRWTMLGGDIIPEPTTCLLFGIGLLPMLHRPRRRTGIG